MSNRHDQNTPITYLDEITQQSLSARLIPESQLAGTWPTGELPEVGAHLNKYQRLIQQSLLEGRGWILIQTGLSGCHDSELASCGWNLFTSICEPVAQYQTGELVHWVQVVGNAGQDSSHYSQSRVSGGYHTDGTLLYNPPGLAMLAGIEIADEGGETVIVDGRKLLADMRAQCPEQLRLLEAAQPFFSGNDRDPVVTHPILSSMSELLPTIRYMRRYVELGYAKCAGNAIPMALQESLDELDARAAISKYQTPILVGRGAVLIWNNSWCLHGRRRFRESHRRRRLLRAYGSRIRWM